MLIWRIVALSVALLFAACAAQPTNVAPKRSEDYRQMVRVVDDPMSTNVILLGPELERRHEHSSIYRNTVQLVAGIDRTTGSTIFMVSHSIHHGLKAWLFVRSVTYMDAAAKPVTGQEFRRDRGDVTGCGKYGCYYTESGRFTVPEPLLRQIAELERQNGTPAGSWRIRFHADGGAIDLDLPFAYVDGFLQGVDDARARRK